MSKHSPHVIAVLIQLVLVSSPSAAESRTANFIVTAESEEIARKVGAAAEQHRKTLALLWLGKELAAWSDPCLVRVSLNSKQQPLGYTRIVYARSGGC